MFSSKSSLVALSTGLLICSSLSHAEIFLKPTGPSTFGTVSGVVGLQSEAITEGSVSASVSGMSTSTPVSSAGEFTLSVGADSVYSINASLSFEGVPSVNMNFINLPAISEGETRQLDLTRASGRILGQVNVVGGTLESLSVVANSSETNGTVIEQYGSSGNVRRTADQAAEVLLAIPAGIETDVSGNAEIITSEGCEANVMLEMQSVTVLSNNNPVIVEWNVDVSSVTCNLASLDGTFRIDGLDAAAVLMNHELSLFGPVIEERNLTEFGPYRFDQLVEGNYGVFQKSVFAEPFGELTYPDNTINVIGNTTFDAINSVGIAKGQVNLSGQWGYTDLKSVRVSLNGATAMMPASSMSASDNIDLQSGGYDLVLGVGNWDLRNYVFNIDEETGGVRNNQFVNVQLLPQEGVNRFPLGEGQMLNLVETAFETFSTELEFVVEQQSGLPEVTIEKLNVSGSAQLFDSMDESLRGATSLLVFRTGPQASRFLIMMNGLPGTYQMTARGIGSDGRLYIASFELVLGDEGGQEIPEPMACFGVNKMMVHLGNGKHHSDKDDDWHEHGNHHNYDDDDDDIRHGKYNDGKRHYKRHGNRGHHKYNRSKRHYKHDDGEDDHHNSHRNHTGWNDDRYGKPHSILHIQKAGFRLPEEAMVDLNQENVSITVDGIIYEIPAGSFTQRGDNDWFVYQSPRGEQPQIHARLNLDKAQWKFRVKQTETLEIDNSDGVDVTLTIGEHVGTENIIMRSQNRHGTLLKYKRKPKVTCGVGHILRKSKHKDDEDDNDSDDNDDDKDDDKDD